MGHIRRDILLFLTFGICLVMVGLTVSSVSAQEWDQTFNPYTGKWEDVNPPAAPSQPELGKQENAPTEAAVVPEIDYTSKEAALQILQHKEDEAAKWMYEQPMCPSMHYHKPLKGNDVCANQLGDDVAVSCPAGTSLVTDHHPAGSDACRSRRSF